MTCFKKHIIWISIVGSLLGAALSATTTGDTGNTAKRDNQTNAQSAVTTASTTTTTTQSTTTYRVSTLPYGYCPAYCNIYGYPVPRRLCPSAEPYCCGTRSFRYCCGDRSRRLPIYSDEKTCAGSIWWFYNWKVIVGLLGTVMVVMMFGACVYYCCMGICRRNETVQRVHRRFRPNSNSESGTNMNTISGSTVSDPPTGRRNSFPFDPANPNAFTPPAYESLPKDPPKYADIFNENGQLNAAFVADEVGASSSMEAAEAVIAAGTVGGAAGGVSGEDTSGGATTPSTSTASNPSAASPSSSASARASETNRNRTTETTAIPAVSQGVATATPLSEVHVDSPPPYTREDVNAAREGNSNRGVNQGNTPSTTSTASATSDSGSATVHRIEVVTRTS